MRGVPRLVCVYPIEFPGSKLSESNYELGNPILKFTNQPKTLISHFASRIERGNNAGSATVRGALRLEPA